MQHKARCKTARMVKESGRRFCRVFAYKARVCWIAAGAARVPTLWAVGQALPFGAGWRNRQMIKKARNCFAYKALENSGR
ncbi:hypothetical protein JCM19000A_33410 [Silvimonas sp. JCM 19000]